MAENPVASQTQEKTNDKELNFRALEAKLAQERAARIEAEKGRQEAEKFAQEALVKKQLSNQDDEDDDSEPYVDNKRLNKKLSKFGEKAMQQTQAEIQNQVQYALKEERKQNWIKNNNDFYDVLQHAEKFAEEHPDIAETILEMPEGFERQKLVYQNIKKLGINKPKSKEPSIQEKIDSNKRSPYYQPSGVGTAPYAQAGDYSEAGQKNAYQKMKELQKNLRI